MLSFLYDYTFGEEAIEIKLFRGLTVYSIKYAAIEGIREVGWRDLQPDFITLRLGNRLSRHCVLILTNRGFHRRIALTPHDACKFVDDVNVRLR